MKNQKRTVTLWVAFVILILIAATFLISLPENSRDAVEVSEEPLPELTVAAEDLNNVLPQRVGLNTYFDSVNVSSNKMNYYYSVEDLSEKKYSQRQLKDSLMTEAEKRIPCTLWRPVYMQGVDVSFIYFSNERKELLRFTKTQNACS